MTTPSADLRVDRRDGVTIVAIQGEIDMANARVLRAALLEFVPNVAHGMVVDLSGMTYLDSRGVHLLFELGQRLRIRQQALRIVVPEESPIRRVLVISALDSSVPLDASVEEAASRIFPS